MQQVSPSSNMPETDQQRRLSPTPSPTEAKLSMPEETAIEIEENFEKRQKPSKSRWVSKPRGSRDTGSKSDSKKKRAASADKHFMEASSLLINPENDFIQAPMREPNVGATKEADGQMGEAAGSTGPSASNISATLGPEF